MRKGVNAWVYPRSFNFERVIEVSAESGFQGVELNVDEEAFSPSMLTQQRRADIVSAASSVGLELPSLCSGLFWKYNLGGADAAQRSHGIELGKACCRLASDLGAKVMLVVPGVASPSVPYDKMWAFARTSIREIGLAAQDIGVTVGVENVWNRFLYSPLEFMRFLQEVCLENVRAYFDVGNILLLGFPQQWIRTLASLIACVHVKDFDLKRREFVGLLQGDVPWGEVMSAFRAVGYDGFLNVELSPDPNDDLRTGRESQVSLTKILAM